MDYEEFCYKKKNLYELKNEIGFGSSAVVYYAKKKNIEEFVAIKIIDLRQFKEEEYSEIQKEIKIMTGCLHPNILSVQDSFIEDNEAWIVTSYFKYGSCLDVLKHSFSKGFDNKNIIAAIMKQALEGLCHLHSKGHIHRDIKAGNILIDENGISCLADFGVSSWIDNQETDRRKSRKTFVGSPCWMAPEVMEMTRGYDSKVDIWSFGITLLELAHGKPPFSNLPPMKVVHVVLSNPSDLVHTEITEKLGKEFISLVDLCLQRDPEKRPTAEFLLKHPFFVNYSQNPSSILKEALSNILPIHKREVKGNPFIETTPKSSATIEPKVIRQGRFVVSNSDEMDILKDEIIEDKTKNSLDQNICWSKTEEKKKGRFYVVENVGDSIEQNVESPLEDKRRSRFEFIEEDTEGDVVSYKNEMSDKNSEIKILSNKTESLFEKNSQLKITRKNLLSKKHIYFNKKKQNKNNIFSNVEEEEWVSTQERKIQNLFLLNELQKNNILELKQILSKKKKEFKKKNF